MLKQHISIFDLDHTLLNVNSSFCFGTYLYKHKKLSFGQISFAISCYALHKARVLSLKNLHNKIFKTLFKGLSFNHLESLAKTFINDNFSDYFYSPAVEMLRQAQDKNHYVAILSSSPNFVVRPIAELFGVDDWLATSYSIDKDGYLQNLSQLVQGKEKADYLSKKINQLGLNPANVTVYTDSHLDLPLLQMAGKCIAVNPDNILRRACRENRWQII